ncbi:hypothetical protein DPMN_088729 [Dreissena polymorpha]|uniref:Uncharacterized protein n=1 Tax=Dreissena polymorpha TaxID=45954 RepID=A0A9D4KUM3_DREPO|nr:hypothetical protein DPMN_088729 [Dreissena polymorpha]
MFAAIPPLLTRLRMINRLPRQALINTRVDIRHALLSEQFSASILSKAITPTLGEKLLQETSFPASPNCFMLAASTATGPNLSTFNSQAQRSGVHLATTATFSAPRVSSTLPPAATLSNPNTYGLSSLQETLCLQY